MSMSDLFGSDEGSEASDEDFNLTKEKIANGKENNVSSSDEQSGVEDVNDVEGDENDDDDGDDDDDMGSDKNAENGEDEQDENEQNNENSENEESSGKEEQSDTEQKDEEKPSSKNVSSMDLFGEDVSSEDDDDEPSAKDEKETTVMEASTQEEDFVDDDTHQGNVQSDDEDATDEPEETHINIEIPYSKFSLGSEMSFVKLPNFLSVETKPFDATTYEDEFEEDEVMDDEGRSRLKLRVENTIRWRYAKDEEGNDIKESNARIVRWSDGTMSLLLGAEVFDIHKTKIDGEHNHLFVQQGTGLQAQAIFRDKLTFRPHSTNSQTHRKMTLSIADRVSKTGKIKILPVVGKDPESQKSELIKKEEEKLRSQLRKENQQRRIRERSIARGLSASYLEGRNDDDDDTLESSEQSLLALKRRYKKNIAKVRLGDVYSDQESEDEEISGGLESDDDSLDNRVEKGAGSSETDLTRQKKYSLDESVVKKKRKKVIAESDEEESD